MKNHSTPNQNTCPRALALQTLLKVDSGQYANISVDTALSRNTLSAEDRALYTSLVYGVLERKVTLDFIISQYSSRSAEDILPPVAYALRLGLYQLIYLDRVPDFAAINESVKLVPRKASGFVNAVLRSYLRATDNKVRETHFSPAEFAKRYPSLEGDDILSAAVAYGISQTLTQKFFDVFGEEKASSVMSAFLVKPPISLRVNTLKTTAEDTKKSLTEQGFSVENGLYIPTSLRLEKGGVFSGEEFKNGEFFVQDEASQTCVEVLGARPDELVIDTCACPGSKSFGCAIRMQNMGEIYSFDLHESKLSLVRSGAERLGIDIIKTQKRDARTPDEALIGKADRVLCDVPCSGLGVLAKKPELRNKDLTESARLPAIQREILEKSATYLKSGGVLVYSTCTLLPEENENVVNDFLASHADFCAEDFEISPIYDGLPTVRSKGGCVTLTPDEHGVDGFFIAKLKKL
jgi:16S rRNA (cytosine967-C5)-methyltransferase